MITWAISVSIWFKAELTGKEWPELRVEKYNRMKRIGGEKEM